MLEAVKLVRDARVFGHTQVYSGHGGHERGAVSEHRRHEPVPDELGHPADGAARYDPVEEVALQSGDVGRGQVGDGAVLVVDVEAPASAAEVGCDGALRDDGFGDKVVVRETDAFWGSRGSA